MLLEDAIKLVIKAAEKYGQRSVEECDEIFEATGVVQDFFANKVMTDVERDVVEDHIKNIILFLEENEQYGDDWSEEIKVLKKLIAKKSN
tara:strand:+ start:197 stop:466 length:270 start_codon:yes stop_codon:yes gene_type:complete